MTHLVNFFFFCSFPTKKKSNARARGLCPVVASSIQTMARGDSFSSNKNRIHGLRSQKSGFTRREVARGAVFFARALATVRYIFFQEELREEGGFPSSPLVFFGCLSLSICERNVSQRARVARALFSERELTSLLSVR